MSVHLRPLAETVPPVTPVAAVPDAATGAPTPQQMHAVLQRALVETTALRGRLDALHAELEVAAAQLATTFGELPKLTAVAPGPQAAAPVASRPDPPSPAMSVAIEMAVAGCSRDEVRARLTDAFSIADPGAIVDAVFGPAA